MHKLIFLDKTANCGLGLFFCGIISYVTITAQYLFERLFLPEKLQNSTTVSYKHEFLAVIITPKHIASFNKIQYVL